MSNTQIYVANNKTWYTLDFKQSHEKGLVKDDWKCHLCMYNTGKNTTMFKIIGQGKFKLCCHQCARPDMLKYLFDDQTQTRIVKYMKEKKI